MKKLLLLMLTCTSYIAFAQCVDPVISDFECSPPSHPFSGAGIVSIANPVSGGINTSANVGQFTDSGTSELDNLYIDYGAVIDLSTNSVLHIKIYTTALTAPIPLWAKLQGSANPMEIKGNIDVTGAWKEYTFDFSAVAGKGNRQLVLFFNAGKTNGTATDIYYIDDLFFAAPTTPSNPCIDPIITDFECTAPSHPMSGALVTIANPVSGGINTSAKVGKYTDNGTLPFDALILDYGSAINLATNKLLKIKFYSPTSVQILAKLEGGNTAQEIWSSASAVSTWQEHTFDFSASVGKGNTKVVLFFNAGVSTGTINDIYYIDDLRFESTLSTNDNTLNNAISIYPNPVKNIININSKVDIDGYQITDINGKTILHESNQESKSFTVDISTLESGLYFLKMTSAGSSKTVKIIKE